MSFEAGRSEILSDLVPNSPNVLELSNKLDLNKLFGSGGSHPIVLRVLEQNSSSQSQRVQPLGSTWLSCPSPCWCVVCPDRTVCLLSLPCWSTWETDLGRWRRSIHITGRRRDVWWIFETSWVEDTWKPLDDVLLYFQRLYQGWSPLGIKDAVYHFE